MTDGESSYRQIFLPTTPRTHEARMAILRRERMRQTLQPFAKQPVDLRFVESLTNLLQCLRIFTAQNPVIQRFIFDATFVELPLRVFMGCFFVIVRTTYAFS